MADNSKEAKRRIRAEMREREKTLSAEDSARMSASVMAQFEEIPQFKAARTVLLYMSISGEVETRNFIDRWASAKRMAVPLVAGTDLELRLYDPSKLAAGYRGIPEPSEDSARIDPSEVDFAIVPGVAFEETAGGKVRRLGRGKGFYDRLLPRLSCPVYAAAFGFRMIADLPTDPWDALLDGVCTVHR